MVTFLNFPGFGWYGYRFKVSCLRALVEVAEFFWVLRHVRLKLFKRAWSAFGVWDWCRNGVPGLVKLHCQSSNWSTDCCMLDPWFPTLEFVQNNLLGTSSLIGFANEILWQVLTYNAMLGMMCQHKNTRIEVVAAMLPCDSSADPRRQCRKEKERSSLIMQPHVIAHWHSIAAMHSNIHGKPTSFLVSYNKDGNCFTCYVRSPGFLEGISRQNFVEWLFFTEKCNHSSFSWYILR